MARKAKEEYPATALILTIPGVGPLTALTFVLLLNNDPTRFSKSRDLGCYFGLQPKQQDSGKHVSQLGITKAGDTLMRKLAVQCAHFMLGKFGKDTALKRWGLALSIRGGKNAKKRAVVAVARKLLIIMHRLWRMQESFVPFPGIEIEPKPPPSAEKKHIHGTNRLRGDCDVWTGDWNLRKKGTKTPRLR